MLRVGFWMNPSQARCGWVCFHIFIIIFLSLSTMLCDRQNKETEARGMPCLWSLSQIYQKSQLGYLRLVEGFLPQPRVWILDVSRQWPQGAGCLYPVCRLSCFSVISGWVDWSHGWTTNALWAMAIPVGDVMPKEAPPQNLSSQAWH